FKLFGLDAGAATSITWSEFKIQFLETTGSSGTPILTAIERVFTSVDSDIIPTVNEQIFKSPTDQKVYRIIVTRRVDYFDGTRIVNMYFIPYLATFYHGDINTSRLLGLINMAFKYRFLFIEVSSQFSVTSFKLLLLPDDFRKRVSQLMRELLLIEEDARTL